VILRFLWASGLIAAGLLADILRNAERIVSGRALCK
jgi:hypothetical protein